MQKKTKVLNDDGMAACGFSGTFMTQKVQKFCVTQTSQRKRCRAGKEQEKFWKYCKKRYSSDKVIEEHL